MNFEIQTDAEGSWNPIGSWFDAFIDLGSKLHATKQSELKLKRVLLSVPKSDMVSLALAIGFSRAAFLGGSSGFQEVEIHDIVPGDLIQLRSVWVKTPPDTISSATNVVGRIDSVDKSQKNSVTLNFSFNTSPAIKPLKVMAGYSPEGEKDPIKHIRLFRAIDGTPQRDGKAVRTFPNDFSDESDLKAWIKRWENWEYQLDPTLAIFGAKGRVQEYGRPRFRDIELHKNMLKIDFDSLLNVARLDSLAKDTKPHFVNSIDQIASYPAQGSPSFESFERFPFVCLDGNAAILELSDKIDLDSKCVLGLWETGAATLQEHALSAFVSAATRYRPIVNFEKTIGWDAPMGVQCWGWH